MKCTKIILRNRNEITKSNRHHCLRQDRNTMWFTTGYHGYSYKLSARANEHLIFKDPLAPQLTISTLTFPDDTTFNTGSSMDRWSKKTPRLVSAKQKKHTPRKNMLDDEYDFSCEINDLLEDHNSLQGANEPQHENMSLNLDEYYVFSDIEELIFKHQVADDENEKRSQGKRGKNRQRKDKAKYEDSTKKKKNKFKKTIRFSFSKPPSPETEQVIRVDVTSNVSFEEMTELENSRGPGKIINKKVKDLSARNFDNNNNNNNEKDGDLINKGVEEDFIVKCRQLALTQKK